MQRLPTFNRSFTEIIAEPSVSSVDPAFDQSNRGVVNLLAGWLESAGFTVELMPVQDKPEKLNLIACAGKGEGGLVLSGHTDTVPFDPARWNQDPFRLTQRDNRYYGLGTSDMKSFFPIVLEVLKQIDIRNLRQPLYILATCDEESNMSGARALVESQRALGRSALIGEPTGLRPIARHKGIMQESITLIGRAGHASDPSLGNNALEGMHTVITHLMQWRRELQQQYRDTAFRIPGPTLNFGSIHGGDNPNRICGSCEMKIDLRPLPGMDLESIRRELYARVEQAVAGSGLEPVFNSLIHGLPGMETAADAEIVRLAERLAGEPAGTVAFGTEGPYFNSMGMATVILGPGDIDQAHQANEYLAMDRIEPMVQIVRHMIENLCIQESENVG